MARETRSSSSSSSSHRHGTMITAVVAIAALVAMFMALPDQSSQPGLSDISGNPVNDQAWVDAREGRACKNAKDNTCGAGLTCRQRVPYNRNAPTDMYDWFYRNFTRGERFTCASKIPAGGPCENTGQCVSSTCVRDRCIGAASTLGGYCVAGECDPGLECVNRICRRPAPPAPANNAQYQAVASPSVEDRTSCVESYGSTEECQQQTRGPCVHFETGAGEWLYKHDKDSDQTIGCFDQDCRAFWGRAIGCPDGQPETGGSCTSAYASTAECMGANPEKVCARSPRGWFVDRDRDGEANIDDSDCAQWVNVPAQQRQADAPPAPDIDRDSVPDASDNCRNNANQNQQDADRDGVGDVCDTREDTTVFASRSCADSDLIRLSGNSNDHTLRGTATGAYSDGIAFRLMDTCINSQYLVEYFCESNILSYYYPNCAATGAVCRNGACVERQR
ncbi:TPA: hypothetical protein HA297_02610 [Candidatus Woesearchaeota archaeon]|nr:hypothetical protein [Candidatus Woesearchaeota archaeon]